MRTIKFRGKDANGKWHYGDLLQIGGGYMIYSGSKTETNGIPYRDDVAVELLINETHVVDSIGMFTGLYDDRQEEIYENDILNVKGLKGKVIFYKGQFIVEINGIERLGTFTLSDIVKNYNVTVCNKK
jgi:hypothetical protein